MDADSAGTPQDEIVFTLADGSRRSAGFCERNLNLLAHAQSIELDIGSRCGGHGVCGGDRVRVTTQGSLLSPLTDTERRHLSAAEIADGWRLACQCFPEKSASRIDIALR